MLINELKKASMEALKAKDKESRAALSVVINKYNLMGIELKAQGKTMVFVTHSMGTVKEFCTRAVWLCDGVVKMDGKPDDVIEEYLKETL